MVELKVKELQRTFVSNETFNGALNPVFDSAVPVVISFDDNYAISGGALINSIIRHADKNKIMISSYSKTKLAI